jgi:hypothetical protein
MIVALLIAYAYMFFLIGWKGFQESRWERERQILLERIQAPERVNIHKPGADRAPLQTDLDEMALVGTVQDEE